MSFNPNLKTDTSNIIQKKTPQKTNVVIYIYIFLYLIWYIRP